MDSTPEGSQLSNTHTPLEDSNDGDTERIRLLHAIEEEIKHCKRCPLHKGRTHAVPGEGNYDTVVMFIGEGPGADEDRQGRPFVGRSGQFLTQMLQQIGIRRQDVYITNVVKCRPPDNRDPLPHELEACSNYLERQIELINPRIIVTLGRFSMARWFPNGKITKIHGQVKNIGRGRVAMALFHPAAALRNPQWRLEFEKDIQKLPLLIERAKAANEAAARGERLPAGVPHPGDPDYRDPTAASTEPAPSPSVALADPADALPAESHGDGVHDDDEAPRQLSLF
jgi:DNA polymerase